MPLFRRKNSTTWWIDITINGERIQRSAGTDNKQQAQEFHDRLKTELWEQKRLGVKPRRTWKEAVVRYAEEKAGKATLNTDMSHLRWLDRYLSDKRLDEINKDLIAEITKARKLPYSIPRSKGPDRIINPKPATINRTLEIIRCVLRLARDEWEWIDHIPSVKLLKEPTRRVSWITREKAEELLQALPTHAAEMMRFALETGLRRANVTHLEWGQVNLERQTAWIHPDQAKAGEPIPVPLSDNAVTILRRWQGVHEKYVFVFEGKPVIQTATKTWRKACASVGLTNFRWHDLRHTWASWHAQDGTPLHVLQELGGWHSAEMVRRYAHLSTMHLADYVNRRQALSDVSVTKKKMG
ncbi:MAG TPA: site-specific integrase [Gallionellaceae bacterium]|nr:site-specific integrase [Gallionellaceae bacterium]